MNKPLLWKKSIVIVILFFIGITAGSYLFHQVQRKRSIYWEYKTKRPLLAGWSSIVGPKVDAYRIYICAGYGWWDNTVVVAALDRQGKELWHYSIQRPCEGLRETETQIVALSKRYVIDKEKEKKKEPGKSISWIYSAHILNKSDGSVANIIEDFEEILVSGKYLYFQEDETLIRTDFNKNENARIPLSRKHPPRLFIAKQDSLFYVESLSLYEWKEDQYKPQKLIDAKNRFSSMRISDRYICFIDSDKRPKVGVLKCLSRDSLQLSVELQLDGSDQYRIFDHRLYHFNKDHNLFLTDLLSGQILTLPLKRHTGNILNEYYPILYLVNAHEAMAFDLNSNKEIWSFGFGGWVRNVVKTSEQLLITDDDGVLTALPLAGPSKFQ